MTFDPNWPHGHVYCGRPAKLVYTNQRAAEPRPYLFVIEPGTESEDSKWFTVLEAYAELENAPAPKRRVERWINLYANGSMDMFSQRSAADTYAIDAHARIACKHVVIEEGEGL